MTQKGVQYMFSFIRSKIDVWMPRHYIQIFFAKIYRNVNTLEMSIN